MWGLRRFFLPPASLVANKSLASTVSTIILQGQLEALTQREILHPCSLSESVYLAGTVPN